MKFNISFYNYLQEQREMWMLVKEAFVMKKALAKIQKTEINTYIDEFVKARQ